MSGSKIRYSSVKRRGDIRKWKDRLVDVPVFILGNGPSLNDEDISSLSNYFTIGINRSFLKLDSTILLWQDASLWFTERKNLLETKSIKYCTSYGDPENRFLHFKIKSGQFLLPEDPTILFGSGSSTPLAVQLAYLFGCNPIILLGCDCKKRGNDTDFYGKNKFHNEKTMNNCLSGLSWIKTEIHDKNVRKIISCSDNDIFQRENLSSILSSIDTVHKKEREYWNQYLV